MDDTLAKRVKAAAVAGWITVLLFAAFLTVAWLMVMLWLQVKPQWVLKLCGGGEFNWDKLQMMYLWGFAIMKMLLWAMLAVVVWLSLWSWKLKRLS